MILTRNKSGFSAGRSIPRHLDRHKAPQDGVAGRQVRPIGVYFYGAFWIAVEVIGEGAGGKGREEDRVGGSLAR